MNHVVSLEVLNTLNPNILRIVDTSVYHPSLAVTCPTLNVTLPGFAASVEFTDPFIEPGFTKNLTACDLEVQVENCGSKYSRLPDGIYIIKYSVAPNEIVYAEYNFLKVSQLMQNYKSVLCELDISAAEPRTDQAEKMKLLNEIRMYIEAAKAKVEICHEPKKGMELYTYAKKLLSKFDCRSCY